MLLLEHKLKLFLEDKRDIKDKLLDEWEILNKKDTLLRMFGMLQVQRHKKWIHRAKYLRKNIKTQGFWKVSWEKIAIGKK